MKLNEKSVARVHEIINEYRQFKTPLMMILSKVQNEFGYIPLEVQEIISKELDIPVATIYGVVTFYSFFSLKPKGRVVIGVCLGTACYVKGSGDILEKIKQKLGIEVGECTPDGKFSLDATRCIGACGLAPVLTVNDDVYGRLVVDDVDKKIKKYMNIYME